MAIQGTPDLETFQSFMFHYSDQKILMQFTGLQDKNGKDIYFGDILSTSNDHYQFDLWTKEDYGYSVVIENEKELGVSFSNWVPEHSNCESCYDFFFVEVIGNIYENPELITDN